MLATAMVSGSWGIDRMLADLWKRPSHVAPKRRPSLLQACGLEVSTAERSISSASASEEIARSHERDQAHRGGEGRSHAVDAVTDWSGPCRRSDRRPRPRAAGARLDAARRPARSVSSIAVPLGGGVAVDAVTGRAPPGNASALIRTTTSMCLIIGGSKRRRMSGWRRGAPGQTMGTDVLRFRKRGARQRCRAVPQATCQGTEDLDRDGRISYETQQAHSGSIDRWAHGDGGRAYSSQCGLERRAASRAAQFPCRQNALALIGQLLENVLPGREPKVVDHELKIDDGYRDATEEDSAAWSAFRQLSRCRLIGDRCRKETFRASAPPASAVQFEKVGRATWDFPNVPRLSRLP